MGCFTKKRSLGIIVTLCMIVSVAVGCGGNTSKQDVDSKVEEKKVEVDKTTSKKEPVSIKMLSWETTAKTSHEKLIKSFKEKNPEIDVTIDYVVDANSAEYMKKVDVLLMSGEQIDIVSWPGIQDAYQRIYKNLFEPLDDYIKTENIKYEDTYVFAAKNQGKVFALPGDEKIWLVMLNKSMLDTAGLSVPKLDWTWDDYKEYAKKLTKGEGENKVYGSYMHTWDTLANMGVYSSKVGSPFWKDENAHNLDDANLKDWMKFKFDLENVDNSQMKYFDAKSGKVAYRDIFFKGKVAMLPIGTWMISELKDTAKYPHDFVTTFAALPRWKDAPEGRSVADSLFYCLSKNSTHKQEAYNFMRYYTTDGQYVKALGLSAQKGADNGKIVDSMIKGSESLYDVAALKSVLNNPKRFDNVFDVVPKADKAVKDIFMEEYEKYMVGDQNLDTTMVSMKKRADEAVKASK